MLPAAHRLRQDKDFKRLVRRSRPFFSPPLQLRLVRNSLPRSRFAFVVAGHVSKRATVRNRLKRRLREITRLNLKHITAGYDVLISSKKPALSADYRQLQDQLLRLLKQARIWHD